QNSVQPETRPCSTFTFRPETGGTREHLTRGGRPRSVSDDDPHPRRILFGRERTSLLRTVTRATRPGFLIFARARQPRVGGASVWLAGPVRLAECFEPLDGLA